MTKLASRIDPGKYGGQKGTMGWNGQQGGDWRVRGPEIGVAQTQRAQSMVRILIAVIGQQD